MLVVFIIGAGVIGLIIGWFIGLMQNKVTGSSKVIKQDLDSARSSLKEYQQQVSEHINKTNDLIQNIYAQANQLKEHTEGGTMSLNRDTSRQSLLQPSGAAHGLSEGNISIEESISIENEQPIDYASK
ncbi:MAG: uncharacterized membrane-anchored protein YhcB (DUF1043 family) [Francisellaceae bacterium]|jgi:uncharacterized membrane-anchored protein YhcB (DUF1043 family)